MRLLLPVLLVLLVLTLPGASAAEPAWERLGGPRLRPQDDRTAMLLQEGLLRSASIRRLVARLEAGDLIVYLETQPQLAGRLSGCLTWMANGGSYRYVRASIAQHLTFDAAIAAIGHELAHAVEVLEARSVASEVGLVALYRRIGLARRGGSRAWETTAAQRTGGQVHRELRDTPVTAVASALEPLSVAGWPGWYRRQLARQGA